jgi:hypothetical protein
LVHNFIKLLQSSWNNIAKAVLFAWTNSLLVTSRRA